MFGIPLTNSNNWDQFRDGVWFGVYHSLQAFTSNTCTWNSSWPYDIAMLVGRPGCWMATVRPRWTLLLLSFVVALGAKFNDNKKIQNKKLKIGFQLRKKSLAIVSSSRTINQDVF